MTLLTLLLTAGLIYIGLRYRDYKHNYKYAVKSHKELLNQNVIQQQQIKRLEQENSDLNQELKKLKQSLCINPKARTQTMDQIADEIENNITRKNRPYNHDFTVSTFNDNREGFGSSSRCGGFSYLSDSSSDTSSSSTD